MPPGGPDQPASPNDIAASRLWKALTVSQKSSLQKWLPCLIQDWIFKKEYITVIWKIHFCREMLSTDDAGKMRNYDIKYFLRFYL